MKMLECNVNITV